MNPDGINTELASLGCAWQIGVDVLGSNESKNVKSRFAGVCGD